MSSEKKYSRAHSSGAHQGGKTNDADKNTQQQRQDSVLSPRVRGSLPNPTELSNQLEKKLIDQKSDESFMKSVEQVEKHLSSCGLMAIWRPKDQMRIDHIRFWKRVDQVVRDVR